MAKNKAAHRPVQSPQKAQQQTRERVLVLSSTGKRRFAWRDKH